MLSWLVQLLRGINTRLAEAESDIREVASRPVSAPFERRGTAPVNLERESTDLELIAALRAAQPNDWLRLAQARRYRVDPRRDVERALTLPPDDGVELLGASTMSADGRIRGLALEELRKLGHPRGVPYALSRIGDWVPEVRQAAIALLRALMERGVASELVEHHVLIERLRLVGRVDLTAIEREIEAYLTSPSSVPAVERGLSSPRVATRVFCLGLLESSTGLTPQLVERALRDRDPKVRMWIVRRSGSAGERLTDEHFRALLMDRSSAVSAHTIRLLTPEAAAERRATLVELSLADTQPVREAARFALHACGEAFGIAAECRARLTTNVAASIRPGWIAALGASQHREDIPLLLPFLEHPRAAVRAAAVLALGHLDRDGLAGSLVQRLADSNGLVRRAAISAVVDTPASLWRESATELLEHGRPPHQLAALSLLTRRGGWDALPAILQGLTSESHSLRQAAWHRLGLVTRQLSLRGWIRPSPSCLEAMRRLWPLAHPRFEAMSSGAARTEDIKRLLERALASDSTAASGGLGRARGAAGS